MKTIKINMGTFPHQLTVLLGTGPDKDLGRDDGITMLEDGEITIKLAKWGEPEQYGQLAHEVFHAVEFLFEHLGIKHNRGTSELWAYQVQYLYTEIIKQAK